VVAQQSPSIEAQVYGAWQYPKLQNDEIAGGPGCYNPISKASPIQSAKLHRSVHRILADAGFQSVMLEPRDFDLDIACGGGIEEALEAATALGPISRALQDHDSETRAAVATSIRHALQPYQRGRQVALTGAIWLVTANNA
jgi:hypothetical protein